MDYRQTLLVLLSVLLCSSQGLTETPTEAALTPQDTSTESIPKSTPQGNVSDLLKMMNILNLRILDVTKAVIRHDEMNTKIMTRLDEMNSESVKQFDENNSTMFSLFDKLDKKILKNSDESLKKSQEMDNKLMKRLDEMNAETVNRFNEMDLRVKSLDKSITNSSEINLNKYLTLSEDMKKFSIKLDGMEARLQPQEVTVYRKEKQFVLFTNGEKTWIEAYHDCIKRNMSLASIESEEDNNKVLSLIKNSDKEWFWLSGTDLGHTYRYVWVSTGRDVTYNRWQKGDPNNYVHSDGEVEHCMSVRRYDLNDLRWRDERCSIHTHYICQHWV